MSAPFRPVGMNTHSAPRLQSLSPNPIRGAGPSSGPAPFPSQLQRAAVKPEIEFEGPDD
jgi:hypothetical protein